MNPANLLIGGLLIAAGIKTISDGTKKAPEVVQNKNNSLTESKETVISEPADAKTVPSENNANEPETIPD